MVHPGNWSQNKLKELFKHMNTLQSAHRIFEKRTESPGVIDSLLYICGNRRQRRG